jgi:starch phosphorylase
MPKQATTAVNDLYLARRGTGVSLFPKETRPDHIAYFSMEVGLDSAIPTYSGGLGVLAGDTLRAAADLGLPMVGITLLHRRGYFRQRLDAAGNQID